MKFHYSGHRKDFKDIVTTTSARAKELGVKAECRGNNFYAILTWRHNKPQYAFRGILSNESDFIIEGEIELIGTAWKCYDYLFYVPMCIFIVPLAVVSFISRGINVGVGLCSLPFSSKKNQKKRLCSYMTKVLQCEEIKTNIDM